MKKITVYFITADRAEISRIRKDYGVVGNLSVNGEIECYLSDEVVLALSKEVNEGIIQIRKK